MTRMQTRPAPTIHDTDTVAAGVRALLESDLPALPVVDEKGHLVGLFGEREFMAALFPGYVGELHYAGFVSGVLDDVLEKRAACSDEPVSKHMNSEHVWVDDQFSDVGLAETFLHHRVLVVPVERDGRPVGVVVRADFFRRLAEAFIERA